MKKSSLLAALLACLALVCTSTSAAEQDPCSREAWPLASLIDVPFLIFGELHGTAETPAIVGAHACALLQAGKKVLLALEIPDEEQDRIDAFMATGGSPADVRQLLAGPHWQRAADQQDGRSSEAMLRLIQLARQLAGKDHGVRVLAFDHWGGEPSRDAMMARNMAGARQRFRGYSTVALAGNLHAMSTRSTPFDPNHEPMAYLLSSPTAPKPVTIDVVPTSGQSWFCAPACGEKSSRQAAHAHVRCEAPAGHEAHARLRWQPVPRRGNRVSTCAAKRWCAVKLAPICIAPHTQSAHQLTPANGRSAPPPVARRPHHRLTEIRLQECLMVQPVIATLSGGRVYFMNLDGNVGLNSPNLIDDVQLVQFGFLAMAANTSFNPADRAVYAGVTPGAAYTGSPTDPLTLAIKRHQANRGGTQDGHVSVMTGNMVYNDASGKHTFQMVALMNNIRDFTVGLYPRIDRHARCPPALAAKVRGFA